MAISTPSPADNATSVSKDATLSWVDTVASDYWKVYFGTNESAVTNKETAVYRGIVYTKAYDPRITLLYGTEYFWRITAVKAAFADVDSSVYSFTVITQDADMPAAKNYRKRLCAVANDAFHYENNDSPPTTVALSGLTLDTSKSLQMFELQQKVYIVNETAKKVVDFVNTKLTLSGSMTVPPRRGFTISQLTSGAQMVVDYVKKGALTVIYGRTITGTFTTTPAHTLSGDTMSPTTLYPTAVAEPTTPHYYDWDVYADVTGTGEFGAMPARITMGCNYRARAALSGNSSDPHQWYQSRQANPYDWTYAADDAQSPVAGNDADAGKVGDIITAQIPYSDDFLIYASIGKLYLLRGDAAAGGSLDMLDENIGVVSPNAWCWDDQKNLYLLDLKGLYRIKPGLVAPEALTSDKIPNFVTDLALNPETQRIVLVFDPIRYGIQIHVTDIETGVNQNYWYDLHSEGFFPETYPEQCGVFCAHFYQADDPSYRKVMMGTYDGHIKIFDDTAKSDDIGTTASPASEAVNSYALLGPVMIGQNHAYTGRMKTLSVVSAGGKAGGTIPDSDGIDYEIYVDDSAEGIMEKVDAGGEYLYSGLLDAPGRNKTLRRRARGVFLAVKLGNDTLNETWGLERVVAEVEDAGRAR